MTTYRESRPALLSLRTTLQLDAVVTGANGLAYIAGATVLDDLLGPAALVLAGIGVFLIGYALLVAWAGARDPIRKQMATLIVYLNVTWVAASLVVAASDLLALTTVGRIWVVLQAIVVGGFALVQVLALRASHNKL
ncbi:hypothetical protein [Hoyosella altamirensis]|uniref:Integral membrane protein n=1 Tax=Hoyosella altamirensis TaxID=616997 RepID=A0A839RMW2_9ACTN|nr:hypothetical protein [Hoyosella altamirensis]MBB3038292.1 hypothetical protein [Hoyosella altamirensis]